MTSSAGGAVSPFSLTRSVALLSGLASASLVWTFGVLLQFWQAPLVGWLLLPCGGLASAWICLQTAATPMLAAPVRRFWRLIALSAAMVSVAALSNMVDAFSAPGTPGQQIGPRTLALFALTVLIGQFGLLTLPAKADAVGGWLQFALDSSIVLITGTIFVWYFAFRTLEQGTAESRASVPVLTGAVFAFVSTVAFVKVSAAGTGPLDRTAMRLLAIATVGSALSGGMAPLFLGSPPVSGVHLALPIATLVLGLAADRQRRAVTLVQVAAVARRRTWSVLPYVAVAATNALLLVGSAAGDGFYLAVGAVTLTAIVVVRQVRAFVDNAGLLKTVDASVLDLSEARDQLTFQANHDDLTRLPNRRLLERSVAAALDRHPQASVHLAIVDLDDFKTINDRLGHHVGDELLRAVANRLITVAGPYTSVFRLGGDEFAVLLAPCTTDGSDAELEEAAEALRRPVQVAGHELMVQSSIGLTDGEAAREPRELLRRADVAMYAAKERGKGRVVRFEPAMDIGAAENARIANQLRRAIERHELHLVYQPIVELPHGRIIGAEALVRWNSPDGLVPPTIFVPVAERNGLIVSLGEWILREACRQAVLWQHVPGENTVDRISVNVSARQLREPDFAATVATVLRETGLPASRLTVEVTETAVFDGGVAVASLEAVHRLGVRIALDDFGTGHSSLGLLRNCPVDVLKVDKSFVDEVTMDGEHSVIAAALIQIATGLHLDAVAEGVEHAEQAERLYRLGYRFAQGYHFARPMPAAELTRALEMTTAAA